MSLIRRLQKKGGAPLNTDGMQRPAMQRSGAFGIIGLLQTIRGKSSDKQPWSCVVVIKEFDTAGAKQSATTLTIVDAVGDEPTSLPAWTLSDDGRILSIPALRHIPKVDDKGTACAKPIELRAGVHAVTLTYSKIPNPIPPIGSIVEATNIVAKASKGFISWNSQELRASAMHSRLPAELAVAETMPYGIPCLDLVGPSRIGDFSHTSPKTPMPVHPSDSFPETGMSFSGGISPVLRFDVNRHMPRELMPGEAANDQRFILPPECMLLSKDELDACAMEREDSTTLLEPKIYQRTLDATGVHGKLGAEISVISAVDGPDHERQQTVALVKEKIYTEPFCANAGAGMLPPLWEAFTHPTAPDLKDCLPMVPHHMFVTPDYEGSRTVSENAVALTDYEQECQAAMEEGKPKPDAPKMQLRTFRVLGYVPRVCEYAHQYGIPVSPQMVRRRFDATGARPTEVYSPNDLYVNGSKKFTRESFIKVQTLAVGKYNPLKNMDKELFERPWTFQHHVGWVLADWQQDPQWIDQILGDERRSAEWLWYAFMLVKPESHIPYGSAPDHASDSAEGADPFAKVRPLPGCTLRSPTEGDAWIAEELKARYARMSDEKKRPFVGKNKNSAPLELLPDWRNIWMQSMPTDALHTLPIMVFVAVRANTKGMTVLGLAGKKRAREPAAAGAPSSKRLKTESGAAAVASREEEDEDSDDAASHEDAMVLDKPPPEAASQ